MSSRANTPSPPQNTLMAPPATPGASASPDTVPRTPNSRATTGPPQTPGTTVSPTAHTPGGSQLKVCTVNTAEMAVVNAHTVKCNECDRRSDNTNNLIVSMHPVLRCPGCGINFCKDCRDKRAKDGRGMIHRDMGTPGGLMLRSGGVSKRRILPGSPAPSALGRQDSVNRNTRLATPKPAPQPSGKEKGKGKEKVVPVPAFTGIAKVAGKKRAAKSKPSKPIAEDESSDDDFMPDPSSPTSNKRRRIGPAITDEPTATTNRPHRSTPASASHPTYAAPSSPDGSVTSTDLADGGSEGLRPSMLNTIQREQQWSVDVAPPSRMQELLEEAGVNTPNNRYDEHLMSTYTPIMSSPTIKIPERVKRMAYPTPRMTAEEKVDARNRAAVESAHAAAASHLVRNFALREAAKFQSPCLSADENEELADEIKKYARRWACRVWRDLPEALQQTVDRGLDMRLDHVDEAFRVNLGHLIEKRARKKVQGFEKERDGDDDDDAELCEGADHVLEVVPEQS